MFRFTFWANLLDALQKYQAAMYMRWLFATLLFVTSSLLSAPTVKRLLILPAVNESGSADNAYIGPSLASAIQLKLAEQYFFFHPDEEAVVATQNSNFIQNEDLHTKSAALQMGEWLRQDLVLNGKYSTAGNRLRLILNLYEIETGRLLVNFKTEIPLSAKMFDAFNAIATQLGEQMAQALPSQQELSASGGSYYDPEKGKRALLLSFGTRAAGFSGAEANLTSASTVSSTDFPHLNVDFSYQRHSALDIFSRRYRWPVFAQFTLSGGYGKRDYTRDNSAVPARLIAIEAMPAIGYSFSLRWFRFEPYLGAGLGYSNVYLDYSNLPRKPVDTSVGQSLTGQTIEQFCLLTQAGAVLKYSLHPRWAIVMIPAATFFHFAGGAQAEINVKLGAGFYF